MMALMYYKLSQKYILVKRDFVTLDDSQIETYSEPIQNFCYQIGIVRFKQWSFGIMAGMVLKNSLYLASIDRCFLKF